MFQTVSQAVGGNPYLFAFLIAMLPRVLVAGLYPYDSGDWPVYRVVAENILVNHCVSQSIPSSGLCLPHWGGNQLPGFPFVAAVAWALSGTSDFAILLGQSILTALAICRLMQAVKELTRSSGIALAAGLVLSLSPVSIGWARSLNTETLALATTIWVLAELLISLARNRLQIWTLGLALAAAVFIRYDGVFLCLLVALCAFLIHRPYEALRRGALVALILAAPLAPWTVRSVSLGLQFPPPPKNLPPNLSVRPASLRVVRIC